MEQENVWQYHFGKKISLELKHEALQKHIISKGINEQRNLEELHLQKSLEDRVRQEEKVWKQKSHINWIKCAEINSEFFHH